MAASSAFTLPSPSFVFSSKSPRRFRRFGVVAMASVRRKVYAPGVSVSEGNGGLPKVDLKSPHGRHDTSIPFKEVLLEFEDWMGKHNLWSKEQGGSLNSAAFVTCGNWDLKTKVPEQCRVSKIKLPTYLMEWINLKDIYLNFYDRRATGMMTMMRQLEMPIVGSHHLGIGDSKNIARVVQRMLADGCEIKITAKRQSATGEVKFLFKNRIR